MKKLTILFSLMLFLVGYSYGQRVVKGSVVDTDGVPLIGANVLVPGSTVGTITDFDGTFSISVPTDATTLEISYTGYDNQSVDITGINNVSITLTEGKLLDEIVVTALGIERKKDDDLSSSTLIKTDAVLRSGETGVLQGLAGKTSGVAITQNTGDPGAGAFIQIRGQNTILGSGSPLIVVDGVPISNSSYGGNTAGVVQQSRFNDIPATDIESITVLKGAAAAAIWGSGAANGVIVVKTKRGAVGKGNVSIEVNASIGIDQINREHEKQGLYGQGAGGAYSQNASGLSWGDKISARAGGADAVNTAGAYFVSDQSGKTYYPVTGKNSKDVFNQENRDLVFRNGLTQNYSIGVSYGGSDKSNTYLGYSRLDQVGIINGQSDYLRNTFRVNHTRKFNNWLEGRINATYAGIKSDRIQTGSNLNGLYLGYLRTSPDFDSRDYSGTYYSSPTDAVGTINSQRSYRNRQIGEGPGIYNNPGWTINKLDNPNDVDRFIISPELNFTLASNVVVTARYGLDFYQDDRSTYFPANSAGDFTGGAYYKDDYSEKIENFNIFVNGNSKLTETGSMNWIVGYQIDQSRYNRFSSSTNNLLNTDPSKQILTNAVNENILAEEYNSLDRKNGLYGQLQFDLFDGLLIETSGRIERSTTVSDKLNFYPSLSAGYVFTNKMNSDVLTFGKLRASYGEVGIEPTLYRNKDIFFTSTAGSEGWGDYLDGANYGGTVRRGEVQGNPDLNVERVKEFEVGADLRFFKNTLSAGITYYNRKTEDAILEVEYPASTGYASGFQNVAEISNKGIEVDFNYNLFSSEDFSWNVFGNVTSYKNVVEKLPGVSRYILNGFTSTSSALVEGQPFAAIYGGRYLRDANGAIVTDELGFPVIDDEQGVIGDPNPNWRGGLGSALAYKGISFSFQFETSQGNDMWGGTNGVLHYFGIAPETANESVATQDLNTYFGDVIPAGTTFRGNIADFGAGPVALEENWYRTDGGGFGTLDEQFVQDASWTKLREVSLGYTLPSSLFGKTGIKGAEIGISGRNLLIITDFKGVDPEVNLTGASKGRGLDYFTNPSTKSYIFNVKLRF